MTKFSSKLPLWYQLASLLRGRIMSGMLAPGARILPEIELAATHGLSVITARQALRALTEEGLITRTRGRGTFVTYPSSPPPGSTPLELMFYKEFHKPAKVLERSVAPVPPQFGEYFDQAELRFIRRIAFSDEHPVSDTVIYVPPELDAKLSNAALRRYPVYRILQDQADIRFHHTHFEAQALPAAPDIAENLAIDPFSPVLHLSCVSFDASNHAVCALQISFRSDRFIFSFDTLHGQMPL